MNSADIKNHALEIGFDLCGVSPAAGFPELAFLREWIAGGYAGNMRYMARTADRRSDIRRILPSAGVVIVAAMVYNVDRPYSTERRDPGEASLARYAWGDDYLGQPASGSAPDKGSSVNPRDPANISYRPCVPTAPSTKSGALHGNAPPTSIGPRERTRNRRRSVSY